METLEILSYQLTGGKKLYLLLVLFALLFSLSNSACASSGPRTLNIQSADSNVSREIKTELQAFKALKFLRFPNSVTRFYEQNGFQPVWVKKQSNPKQTWDAMLLLDCVLQFGLSHDDYHAKELSYDRLHIILDHPEQVNDNEKARYDITLTDALITFTNHLHFGKLNPHLSAAKIDAGDIGEFCADDVLAGGVQQKNVMATIVGVQPKTKAYADLQYHMHMLEGVYQGDCYNIPEETVRKMAVNMERMRWANADEGTYLQVNIPSYTLNLIRPDTSYQFKVIVGKPSAPTPVMESELTYFTTAQERKTNAKHQKADNGNIASLKYAPRYNPVQPAGDKNPMGTIFFWFSNKYGISLKGTPQKQLFKKPVRDLSNGGILVENGEKLAGLLLIQDGNTKKVKELHDAIGQFKVENFTLKKPVPVRITYYTCEMQNGVLVDFGDVYSLDKQLEKALYNINGALAMK